MSTAILDHDVRRIDGTPGALAALKGQVLLVVNVASECGLTPQYGGLETLYETYRDRGFAVLGFPANEFGAQEPGTNTEIQQFCRTSFGVQFPMFEKVVVKGAGQHPLFAALVAATGGADISWNFEKFLIGRDGAVAGRFAPTVKPDDPALVAAIEAALGT